MNDTYVTPPTRDPGPVQWTRMDLALATSQGRHHDIVAAQAAGQLRDVMTSGGTHGDAGPRGGRMSAEQAAEITRRQAVEAAEIAALNKEI